MAKKRVFTIPNDEFLKTLGRRLLKVREHHGVKQGEMAQELEISRANLYRLERGDVPPNALVLKNLMSVYDVSINWFLTGKGEMILSLEKQASDEWEFGRDKDIVLDMLEVLYKVPYIRYKVLNYFYEQYQQDKEFIQKTKVEYDRYLEISQGAKPGEGEEKEKNTDKKGGND